MAAARKKSAAGARKSAGSKAGSAKKGTGTGKQSGSLSPHTKRIIQFCAIVVASGLALITLLHLGAAGRFLFALLSLFMGSFTWVFLLGLIALGFWIIWTGGRETLSVRFWTALVFLMTGWCMIAALLDMPADDPWKVLSVLRQQTALILQGQAATGCGYLGAVIAGFFATLFANAGTWIMAVIFLILAASLFGWEFWDQMMASLKENAAAQKEKLAARRREAAEEASQEGHPDSQEKAHGRLFGFLLGEERQPDYSSQPDVDRHPGFAMIEADLPEEERSGKQTGKTGPARLPVLSMTRRGRRPARQEGQQSFTGLEADPQERKKPGETDKADLLTLPRVNPKGAAAAARRKAQEAGKTAPDQEVSILQTGQAKPRPKQASASGRVQPGMLDDMLLNEQEAATGSAAGRRAAPSKGQKKARTPEFSSPASSSAASGESAVSAGSAEEAVDKKTEALSQTEHAGDLKNYKLPSLKLLNPGLRKGRSGLNASNARSEGQKLIQVLEQFGIPASLSEIHIGPSVTKFEITPGQGVRVSAITNLQNDIKMALAATDIRIEAPIPGKSAVGIEVPNAEKTAVGMSDLMRSVPARLANLPLVFALGKDLMGDSVYGRLDTMPHLLIAGATGSGKSVCVNSIICSLLMRTRPDEVKLMLVDPKKVEFTPYNGVPHLMAPVITDGDMANKALKVVVEMMDRRYDLFEEARVRNITAYNAYCEQNPDAHFKKMPRIVVIIDELADLMLVAAKEVEQSIQRITQLARAAGIHLIVATQRPSVNVITGVIKANIPSRIAFMVSSGTDSRTILDQTGAERLLGNGDMLFLDNGETTPRRIQGVFIQDEEVNRITDFVRKQALPLYDDAFIALQTIADQTSENAMAAGTADPLYEPIRQYVIAVQKASTSAIQRRFSVGYGKAARIIDALEANGIVGPPNGSKPREVLVKRPADEEDL